MKLSKTTMHIFTFLSAFLLVSTAGYAQDRASVVTVDMTHAGHNSHYTTAEVIASLAPGGGDNGDFIW